MVAASLPVVPHPSGGSLAPDHRKSLSEPVLGRAKCTASDRHTETSFTGNGLREMLLSPFEKIMSLKPKKTQPLNKAGLSPPRRECSGK